MRYNPITEQVSMGVAAFVIALMLIFVPVNVALADETDAEEKTLTDFVQKAKHDAEKAKAEAQQAIADAEKALAEAEAAIAIAESQRSRATKEKENALSKMLSAGYFPEDIILESEDSTSTAVFSHQKHTQREKLKCIICHPKIFVMKVGDKLVKKGHLAMEEMKKGKFCGSCHDGGKAFDLEDMKNCRKCHPKGK